MVRISAPARSANAVASASSAGSSITPVPSRAARDGTGVMDDPALLALATALAERAGAEIRTIRGRGFQVRHKADQSVVTEADHAAEAIILAGLREALP